MGVSISLLCPPLFLQFDQVLIDFHASVSRSLHQHTAEIDRLLRLDGS